MLFLDFKKLFIILNAEFHPFNVKIKRFFSKVTFGFPNADAHVDTHT